MMTEKLVEVIVVGEEQNEVSKSEAEAQEGVQKKRGRAVSNGNTATAAKPQEKKPRGRPKKMVSAKEEMVTTKVNVKSIDDDNKPPEETEGCMVDTETVTPDREGNDSNEAISYNEGTKGNLSKVESNMCHQCHRGNKGRVVRCQRCTSRCYCVPCITKWYPDMTEEMFADRCPVCWDICNCKSCLPDVHPKSCMKDALDFVSPENGDESIRLTEDFCLTPHNHRAKEATLEAFSNLYEVPITEDLQISQNTKRDMRSQINPECEVGNEGRDGIIKTTITSEEGDHIDHSDPETPNRGGSVVHPATCKGSYEKKGKGNESSNSSYKFVAELHEIRVTRENEDELMRKRLKFEQKREERKTKKVYYMQLNTLLAKNHLSPEDETTKRHLLTMLYGQ